MLPTERYKDMITANQAVAIAAVRSRPQVIAAYPISPQTEIVEYLADYITHGDLKAEYVNVEIGIELFISPFSMSITCFSLLHVIVLFLITLHRPK